MRIKKKGGGEPGDEVMADAHSWLLVNVVHFLRGML